MTEKEGDIMGKKSTATKNAWNAKAYDQVRLLVPKGKKDKLKVHADKQGESLNGFINRAIDETVERDNSK